MLWFEFVSFKDALKELETITILILNYMFPFLLKENKKN